MHSIVQILSRELPAGVVLAPGGIRRYDWALRLRVMTIKNQPEVSRALNARPLVIGVTGHRDLIPAEIPGIESIVRQLFTELAEQFPERPLLVMSPLAEGADRIVALVAEAQGIDLHVPLPMPETLYARDFESSRSWAEFGRLTRYAIDVITLPMAAGNTQELVADYGPERDRQYAEAGAYVAAHADVLVAIWDGRVTEDLGGTGHVVEFRRTGRMPGYEPHFSKPAERNLVFHIACTRDRVGGAPSAGLRSLQTRWLGNEGAAQETFPSEYVARLNAIAVTDASIERKQGALARHSFRVPLVIGVTGHRDLRADELPGIRKRVRELLTDLMSQFPHRKIRIISPLAEGADRLVAEVALELDIEIGVVLPMPRHIYYQDFSSDASLTEFNALFRRAGDVLTLPLARKNTLADISKPGPARDLQYAQNGVFLSAHCHILLALWDGKTQGKLGGTAQVVRFHHHDTMPGYSTRTVASQQMLIDDESDLIYHIVCSRSGPSGAPAKGFRPLECWWFSNDRLAPRSKTLPEQHVLVFLRGSEFSEDATRFKDFIATESYPLMDEVSAAGLPAGLDSINHLFCISDWLAIHYQKLTLVILRATHVFAFLMGFMFILYSDLRTQRVFMFAFLVCFIAATALQKIAKKKGWHRKYLDYRALAEGLRVQFYLAAAGITSDNESKFTHDNFLQTQDPELGWIRNVMRVAGTQCDAEREVTAAGLQFTINEWVGDEQSGQFGYYRRKAEQWIKRNHNTERLSTLSLITSIVVILVILVGGDRMGDGLVNPLFAFMGVMLLLYAVRQGYAQSTAEKELIKQYEFMLRVFENAKRRLDGADDDGERRQIIRALGGSCLDEHAEWILMHRDRSIDKSDIWRLGG
ncbi:MAG TPA: hypothetical protein PKK10_06595 [Woeseiaceae bacterium]|nr:hypothetical protein [Woeseiaceae bacterium]